MFTPSWERSPIFTPSWERKPIFTPSWERSPILPLHRKGVQFLPFNPWFDQE